MRQIKELCQQITKCNLFKIKKQNLEPFLNKFENELNNSQKLNACSLQCLIAEIDQISDILKNPVFQGFIEFRTGENQFSILVLMFFFESKFQELKASIIKLLELIK